MDPGADERRSVAEFYGGAGFEAELRRLPIDSPVERAITLRALERFVPGGAAVAEIGVGGGDYTQFLAEKGCVLHLADIAGPLLRHAVERLRRAGLADRVASVRETSATSLGHLATGAAGAVLLLGPLYHLASEADRRAAVAEAARILRPDGLLFAAGINRLAYLRDLFRGLLPKDARFVRQYLADGKLDPEHAPPIGYSHLTGAAGFLKLFEAQFERLVFTGVESFTAVWQEKFHALTGSEREWWLDIIEATGATPEGIGQSDHFLYAGKRRQMAI